MLVMKEQVLHLLQTRWFCANLAITAKQEWLILDKNLVLKALTIHQEVQALVVPVWAARLVTTVLKALTECRSVQVDITVQQTPETILSSLVLQAHLEAYRKEQQQVTAVLVQLDITAKFLL
jgi:DNA-binding protein YbaB